MSFAIGEQVGPYRVVQQLGHGGMSTVYKAYHAALDRHVALKVLHPAFKGDSNFLERFQREARIVAKLTHPHIVPVYDFSEHEGTPYLVMRYIEGRTLKAELAEQGPLPLERIVRILRPVCDALEYAHGQGILHRDVKPSNILLSQEGRTYVTDFGLARMVLAGDSTISQDRMIGTPQYISPEQAKGDALDRRTDLYSLGVVVFEMLTGFVPYQADTPFAVVHDHIYSPLPLPSSFNPEVPPAVEQAVLKALAKTPDDRYQDAGDLLRALEAASQRAPTAPPAVEGVPVAAGPPSSASPEPAPSTVAVPAQGPVPSTVAIETAAKPGRANRRWVWITASILAVLALAAVGWFVVRPLLTKTPPAAATVPEEPSADPRIADAYPRAGEIFPQERAEEVLAELDRRIEDNPDNPLLHLERGNVLYDLQRWEEAAEAYRESIRLDPRQILSHYNLGVTYLHLRRPQMALPEFEIVLQLNPETAEGIYFNLGIAHAMAGDYREAADALERFLERHPRADVWSRRAERFVQWLRQQE